MGDENEVAVLGCGMVTPFAAGSGDRVMAAASEARCERGADYWAVPDALLDRYPDFGAEIKRDRASWISGASLVHACEQACVEPGAWPADRIALVVGTAFAGQLGMIGFASEVRGQSARFVSPIHFPQTVGNYVAGVLSRAFRIQGPNLTISTGAASGLAAVTRACDILNDDAADLVIAGGFEVLSGELVRGLGGSTFGDTHAGVWSEGACVYVLQRADDAAGSGRTIVHTGSTATDAAGGDAFTRTALVGRSLAAESAMRLHAAMTAPNAEPRRIVTHRCEDDHVITLVVERSD